MCIMKSLVSAERNHELVGKNSNLGAAQQRTIDFVLGEGEIGVRFHNLNLHAACRARK